MLLKFCVLLVSFYMFSNNKHFQVIALSCGAKLKEYICIHMDVYVALYVIHIYAFVGLFNIMSIFWLASLRGYCLCASILAVYFLSLSEC